VLVTKGYTHRENHPFSGVVIIFIRFLARVIEKNM